jgi:hypothetical protein
MGLALNLVVQTIVWFGLMGAIIFGAAGTIDYTGGWLYLGEMFAISIVLGLYMARVDPGLLRERLKPPVQKDQPLADKLIVIPLLILLFGGMGFMAADAARWRWSTMPPSVQWAGCVLPRGHCVHDLDDAHEQLRGPGGKDPEGTRADRHHDRALRDRAPSALFRRSLLCGRHVARSRLVVGIGDGPARCVRLRHSHPRRGEGAA